MMKDSGANHYSNSNLLLPFFTSSRRKWVVAEFEV
jgi:hypothetical protein